MRSRPSRAGARLCVEVSPDGGVTWTAAQAVATTSASENDVPARLGDGPLGPDLDGWGLEYLAVQVTYTP